MSAVIFIFFGSSPRGGLRERRDLELRVPHKQHVVDHVAMVARDVGGGESGIADLMTVL